eukprot:09659.XXX_610523_610741_1 [CDS] Oithona nana genome sequencing.
MDPILSFVHLSFESKPSISQFIVIPKRSRMTLQNIFLLLFIVVLPDDQSSINSKVNESIFAIKVFVLIISRCS